MKYEFKISGDEEDLRQIQQAVNAGDAYLCLWEIEQEIRTLWKRTEFEHDETYDTVENLRTRFYDILRDYNVTLD